jgi:hypothetical protein
MFMWYICYKLSRLEKAFSIQSIYIYAPKEHVPTMIICFTVLISTKAR